MKHTNSTHAKQTRILSTVVGALIWAGVVGGLSAPGRNAVAQPGDDPGQKMLEAAIADVEMLLERERSWIGRPNDDQFTPLGGFASGFEPYDASTVGTNLISYLQRLEELRDFAPEGEDGFLLLAGLSSSFQWSARLGHTSRAFGVLHLEFLQAQEKLEEEYGEQMSAHPERPDPEAFKEALRRRLGEQERQALSELMAARAELADELRQAKADLAERIRTWVLRGDQDNLEMAEAIYAVVTLDNEWNEPLLTLVNTLIRLKYLQLTEADIAGMENVRQLDDVNQSLNLVFLVVRAIEPVAPFVPVPRTYSVASDKASYDHGEVVTINVQGSKEFAAAADASFSMKILYTSAIFDEADVPVAINEGRGDDPADAGEGEFLDEEWEEWDDPESPGPDDEILKLPATFPLEGENPQVIVRGLPVGEFTVLVIELRDLVHTVVAETEFSVRAEPPAYPNYTVYYPPTVPKVITWGTGIPGPDTNDWSHLIPQPVIDEHQLNGRWIIMAVYGQHLFDVELEKPALTWAGGDKHLDYKLLHSGTYSMDMNWFDEGDWQVFWRGLEDRSNSRPAGRPALRIENADVYVVAVHLAPNTWAGPYRFKLGDLSIDWTLLHATNMASTYFTRALGLGQTVPGWVGALSVETGPDGQKMLYERVDALFKYDRFFVEIETTGDVVTSDRIPIDLYRSRAGGAPEPMDFKKYTLNAVRVDGNRRRFRTPLIRLNNPQSPPGTTVVDGWRVFWVPLGLGDRLAARVGPYDVVRQDRLAVARMYATPDKVNSFYRGAVEQAARIAKIELSRPLERMSDGELYLNVLNQKWETVDSTPLVQVGGREVELTVEHLAGMLLLRTQFIASMEEALPRLQKMRDDLKADPSWGRAIWVLLKDDALRPGSPLGDLQVLDWDPFRRTMLTGQAVPFRNAYDEAWLTKTFRGFWGDQAEWQSKVAAFVFNGYVDAAEQALDYAREMDITDPDAEQLLRLTTIGMRAMVSRARPNMLRLVEDRAEFERIGIGFRWEYDRFGRQSLSLLEKLGDEFLKNEARVDNINDATALALALVMLFAPETTAGAILAAGAGIGSAMTTLTHKLPEFFGREADVQFAIGAYLAVGEERYITANLRRIPGWAVALELAGGYLDVVASVALLRHARSTWVAVGSDAEVAAVFAERAYVFAELPPQVQKSALIRLAQLSEMRASGQTLTGLETTILERGTKTLDELGTFGIPESLRYLDPERTLGKDLIVMRDGSIGFISPRPLTLSATLGPETLNALEAAAAAAAKVSARRIPPNNFWHIFDVKGFVAEGGYAEVFKIPLGSRLKAICKQLGIDVSGDICALKVFEAGPKGIADVQRSLQAEAMLAKAGIPQLRIIDHGVGPNNMAYLVQEFMPAPGIYRHVSGKMMDVEMQKALLELHQKMGRKGIGLSDGHSKNLYFEKLTSGRFICGILDQDRVWKYGKGLQSGVWGPNALETTKFILEKPADRLLKGSRMWSLLKSKNTPRAQLLLDMGYCPWPDNEFLMMKMLEHRGWISYDRVAGKFVSERLDIKLVKKYFPRLNTPGSIDTKFDVPAHLRHLVPDRPPSNLPDGGRSFNTLPFPEIMPWVTSMRIAA
ncbi:MAG: hypothetical protein IH889_00945 [Planctomycetes bacterium]|nr:hypothetical protein [Planctomycetota bacterium]